mmetsp:Transcript_20284/g.46818  ORF Transcript_20284/g.46818 Transcript_20284/m.46818 type:complete len:282 (+) Transcript_20284:264-1109(+)
MGRPSLLLSPDHKAGSKRERDPRSRAGSGDREQVPDLVRGAAGGGRVPGSVCCARPPLCVRKGPGVGGPARKVVPREAVDRRPERHPVGRARAGVCVQRVPDPVEGLGGAPPLHIHVLRRGQGDAALPGGGRLLHVHAGDMHPAVGPARLASRLVQCARSVRVWRLFPRAVRCAAVVLRQRAEAAAGGDQRGEPGDADLLRREQQPLCQHGVRHQRPSRQPVHPGREGRAMLLGGDGDYHLPTVLRCLHPQQGARDAYVQLHGLHKHCGRRACPGGASKLL